MSRTITWRRKAAGLTAGVAVAALAYITACSSGSGSDGGSQGKAVHQQPGRHRRGHDDADQGPTFWTWVPDIEKEVKALRGRLPRRSTSRSSTSARAPTSPFAQRPEGGRGRAGRRAGRVPAPVVVRAGRQPARPRRVPEDIGDGAVHGCGTGQVHRRREGLERPQDLEADGLAMPRGPAHAARHPRSRRRAWDAFAQAATDLQKDPNLYLTNLPGSDAWASSPRCCGRPVRVRSGGTAGRR